MPSYDGLEQAVRTGLERAATALKAQEIPVPELRGKLLRPTVAYAMVPPDRRRELNDRFWLGALAIQMAHEASLLHDDILDQADERRGEPTVFARHGIGPALVRGDHYLTASYRAALWTRSPEFLERFITSVERTVAGEIQQERSAGEHMGLDEYFDAILGKSGELVRAAASLGACLLGLDRLQERAQLGLELGALYQQVDDLLDYCPAAHTGKEGLKDYRQRKWTWVLSVADVDSWDLDDQEILRRLFAREARGASPAERAIVFLEVRRAALVRKLSRLVPGDDAVVRIIDEWIATARAGIERQITATQASGPGPVPGPPAPTVAGHLDATRAPAIAPSLPRPTAARSLEDAQPVGPTRSTEAVTATEASRSTEAWVLEAAGRLGDRRAWTRYFRTHARTFSFASRLFPERERRQVEALYAFCRFTDDLVDAAGNDGDVLCERLEIWTELSRAAYERGTSEIPLLRAVMGDAARAGVDWLYPRALLEGVAMDLRPRRYEDWKELGRYTFCVAGAVGGWMTHLFGIRDADTLGRAHALGHAMQLTNILRDVGEDLEMGRVYLPRVLLDEHALAVEDLRAWQRSSTPLPPAYRAAMDELIAVADERYEQALPGIRSLPDFFRRPVAVAAAAYRGIHDEVRRNDYDNLRRRAHTSLPRKTRLGIAGLVRARRARSEVGVHEEGLAT